MVYALAGMSEYELEQDVVLSNVESGGVDVICVYDKGQGGVNY